MKSQYFRQFQKLIKGLVSINPQQFKNSQLYHQYLYSALKRLNHLGMTNYSSKGVGLYNPLLSSFNVNNVMGFVPLNSIPYIGSDGHVFKRNLVGFDFSGDDSYHVCFDLILRHNYDLKPGPDSKPDTITKSDTGLSISNCLITCSIPYLLKKLHHISTYLNHKLHNDNSFNILHNVLLKLFLYVYSHADGLTCNRDGKPYDFKHEQKALQNTYHMSRHVIHQSAYHMVHLYLDDSGAINNFASEIEFVMDMLYLYLIASFHHESIHRKMFLVYAYYLVYNNHYSVHDVITRTHKPSFNSKQVYNKFCAIINRSDLKFNFKSSK